MLDGRRRWLALGAIALVAMWPYRIMLHVWPWDNDAVKWVMKGSIQGARPWRWVFDQSHFIAYRPVAALSFVVDSLFGLDATVIRGTDILLHGLAVVMVGLLFRHLARDDRHGSAWFLLAAALFAIHPVQDEIVPWVSRRSYTLSMVLGLPALWVLSRAASQARAWSPGILGGTALLSLALLSNEIAFALVPVAVLLMLSEAWPRGGWRVAWRPLAVPLAVTLLVWIRRVTVLGRVGGYHRRYVAYTAGGHKHLRKVDEPDLLELALDAIEYVAYPVSFKGEAAFPPGLGWLVALVMVAALVAVGVAAWRRRATPEGRVGLLLLVWLVASLGMVVGARVWFWRLGYPIAVPYVLSLTWLLAVSWRSAERRRGKWMSTAAVVFLAVPLVAHSAVFRGLDDRVVAGKLKGSALVDELSPQVEALRSLEGPVHLVLPIGKGKTHGTTSWLERLHRGVSLEVVVRGEDADHRVLGSVETRDGEPWFVLNDHGLVHHKLDDIVVDGAFPLSELARRGKDSVLLYPDETGWVQVEIPADEDGKKGRRKGRRFEAEPVDTDQAEGDTDPL